MTQNVQLKNKLVAAILVLVMSITSLIGTTFAWFTDSASSQGNVIQSGKLDAQMYWSDELNPTTWNDADGKAIFTYDRWEPGYTEVKYIKVKNAGSLSFKWRLTIEAESEIGKICDVIDVYYINPVSAEVTSLAGKTSDGILKNVISNHKFTDGILLPEGKEKPEAEKDNGKFAVGETVIAIALHMKEEAGNDYQKESIGDGFSVKLAATQFNYENDYFGKDYDENPKWPNSSIVGQNYGTAPVVPTSDFKTPAPITIPIPNTNMVAYVPEGVLLMEDTTELTFSVEPTASSDANITLEGAEESLSYDIVVYGVSKNNTVPISISLGNNALPAGLNDGNFRSYHVENGETVEMTCADGQNHNYYTYNPVTGEVILNLATFSEVALVADTENAWNGTIATSFAGGDGTAETPYLIANADQLAYLSEVISNENETYGSAHYKLLADVNLGGEENTNKGIIFYPIGYHAVGGSVATVDVDERPEFIFFDEDSDYASDRVNSVAYSGNTEWYTYGGAFKGVFDGNGNTIKNIYQNTWQMKGNYSGNYWNEAMGIFGYVYGGTVKNLSVHNFSSDGEFTPTGVVAAYAANANFENIEVIYSNPRVYNTGNGGIVGIGGSSSDTTDKKLTFTNITVDNTNKISALWGSWDVACGGLMGMFRGNGLVNFTKCHVAAQIDVNNDVCANYQYYWYRYSGVMIGSIRKNTRDADGYTVADSTGITATDCTYNLGDWNEYWYCELVKNTIASYTHDHQFSRLEKISSVSAIQDENGNWNKAGNFVIPANDNNSAVCYHIFQNGNGEFYQHFHDKADETNPEIYEKFDVNGDGQLNDLKEDRVCYFMPFNQIFNGDGYGVKPTYEFDGFARVENGTLTSEQKFAEIGNITTYRPGQTIRVGDLFKAVSDKINNSSVYVAVSPATENDNVSATYSFIPYPQPNAEAQEWTDATITFADNCTGSAKVVITDYFYCTKTIIFLSPEQASEKFTAKSIGEQKTYTSVSLGDIFTATKTINETVSVSVLLDGKDFVSYASLDSQTWKETEIILTKDGTYTFVIKENDDYCSATEATFTAIKSDKYETKFNKDFLYRVGNKNEVNFGTVFTDLSADFAAVNLSARIETIAGNASGSFADSKFTFTGTGVVKVTVSADGINDTAALYLEVVNAKNITSATGTTTGGDMVLLSDVNASSYVNYWNCTLYGNGFTYTLDGAPTNYNSSHGHGILITQNATFDNLVIIGEVYKEYGAYKDNDCYNAAIDVMGPTTIQNCYIANCSTPITTRADVNIINTTLYGGTVANLIIKSGTVTLENVTTANYADGRKLDDGRDLVGMGIVIHSDATETAKLVINGTLTQYNFISEANAPKNNGSEKVIYDAMFNTACSKYHFVKENTRYVNTGIISMSANLELSESNENFSAKINGYDYGTVTVSGTAYTVYTQLNSYGSINNGYNPENDPNKAKVQGDYLPTPSFNLGNQAVTGEDTYIKGDINGVEVRYMEGETPLTLDITKLMEIYKYEGINYTVNVVLKDSAENIVNTNNGVITFNTAGSYTLVFTVEDNEFYNNDGTRAEKSVTRTYEVPLSVVIAPAAVKDAVINITNTAQDGSYSGIGDKTITFNPLNAITVTDAEGTVNLTTNIASTDIVYTSSSSAFAGATTITVIYNDGRVLTITLGKPTLNSPGSSKAITYANNGTIKSAGAVASKSATGGTWTVTSYSFKGTNGKTVTNNTVVTFTFPDKSCVTGDTLVMLADGSQKRIDEVTYEDQLLVWNFFTGAYDVVPSAIIFYHGDADYRILNLNFEDGTTVKVINNHGFYSAEENQFVFITEENADEYVGQHFAKVDGDSYTYVELIGYEITEEYTGCYSIQSAMHNNFMTEGMFSLTIPHYEGWFDYFEIGEGMKYDEEKMNADIAEYGLYTYDDFAEYVTYEQFIAFNGPYLKVLVGRGVVTYEEIIDLISMYVNP